MMDGGPWRHGQLVPSDFDLRERLRRLIYADPRVSPFAEIGVQVQNGVVTLVGVVPNPWIKRAAEEDAWWLPPVVEVHNDIRVIPDRRW